MQLEQTLEMYQPMQIQRTQERQRVYTIVDLESLSASALYTGEPCGSIGSSGSGFIPASDLGLGSGIAKESEGFLERYRAGEHEKFGEDHVNLEYISPVTKKPLINIHIDMKDD